MNTNAFSQETQAELLQTLLEAGILRSEQLQAAQTRTPKGHSLIDALLADNSITLRDVAVARSLLLNLPLIDLKRHNVQARALSLIPEETARRYMVIPLDIIENELVVVMENPTDLNVLEDLTIRTGMKLRPALGVRQDIEEAFALYYQARHEIERQIQRLEPEVVPTPVDIRLTVETLTQNPVARVVQLLLEQATRDRASDIHISPTDTALRIRYRIDGVLHDVLEAPLSIHASLVSRIKVLAEMNIAERRRPQDGQFTFDSDKGPIDVRVATADTGRGEMLVMRLLDKSPGLLVLEELGFSPTAQSTYEQLYTLPFGMVLVSGPTGAGKTTTLYATLNRINRNESNLMTIEDPIEYQFDRINQLQVNRQAGITFATGLRAIMRLDPNVILVGEIRDRETAEIAIQAALTGHLVLSTIHANDAVSTIYRLFDLGIEPFLVVSALAGVVAQRLVRQVCTRCRMKTTASVEEQLAFELEMGYPPPTIYEGQGCNFCAETGYRGRVGVFEVLRMSDTLRQMLMRNASAQELREQAQAEGMVPMRRDGMLKVEQGLTTPREVMRNVYTLR